MNKDEFDRDYIARQQIESRYNRIISIAEMFSDTKVLLDHDNYFGSMTYYRYIKFLANENEPGTTSIFKDLQQFFKNKKSGKNEDVNSEPTDE